ncbi:MAG TPA: enoyl-CoA hydratase/isomerase family protein [Polyangiales bacterium]|nr:enoyl-CoA hydratase/isomerase family protein [Polyangiales bacterium]
MREFVKIERVSQTVVWTVDRASARNALDAATVSELEAALAAAEADASLRAVVLTGGGESTFISGADLKLLSSGQTALRAEVDARVLALTQGLEQLPVPVFAALNGQVLGGGCEVALACDMRIAEPHSSVTFKHASLSVTPGWGGLVRLTRTVPPGIAAKLFFSAQPIDAEEARRVGLFDEVVAKGESRARALALAAEVEKNSPSAVADLKRLLRLGYAGALDQAEETRVFLARTESADHLEALAAFREKRRPKFGPLG